MKQAREPTKKQKQNKANNNPKFRVIMVHYSLSFTAYKAASGWVFLRCGTLTLGYNCNSWPCAKMVSTIKGVLVVYYFLGFIAYKAASGRVFLRCGTLSLGYNCTSWPCTKMVSTIKGQSVLVVHYSLSFTAYKAASGGKNGLYRVVIG